MRSAVNESHESADDLVERVHDCLTEAMRRTRPTSVNAPVTVAEIYQDLVPYRAIRSTVGFQMNADYEHTLLRLLAGEGGYVRLEPSEARDELRTELDSPNPNVGLFRKFAACDVFVTPGRNAATEGNLETMSDTRHGGTPASTSRKDAADARKSEPTAEPFASGTLHREPDWQVEDIAWTDPEPELWSESHPDLLLEEEVEAADPVVEPASKAAGAAAEPAPPTGAPPMYESKTKPATAASSGQSCVFCSSALPAGRKIRFCPFCGLDQTLTPCRHCREPLESTWKYCIACGTTRA